MKRKNIIMVTAVVLTLTAMLLASACGNVTNTSGADTPTTVDIDLSNPPSTDPAVSSIAEPMPVEASTAPVETLSAEAREAYYKALDDLLSRYILPDGTECGCSDDYGEAVDNFAIYDVDGDGRDELVLQHIATAVAGQVQYILDYDETTKTLTTELCEFPLLTFYDNGVIKAEWSHNQGMAGDNFWPYNLYKYDANTDTYVMVGMVDAWDKSYNAVDYDGNQFPESVDVSGTGIVYYIMPGGEYAEVEPVDASAYNEWYDSYMSGASVMTLPNLELNVDTLAGVK